MAVTARSEESAPKVKEEAGGREGVAEEKIHRGDPHQGRRHLPCPWPSALWDLLPELLLLHLMAAFLLQVSNGQAALITCLTGLPFLKPS